MKKKKSQKHFNQDKYFAGYIYSFETFSVNYFNKLSPKSIQLPGPSTCFKAYKKLSLC